jgi:hypothetical protein
MNPEGLYSIYLNSNKLANKQVDAKLTDRELRERLKMQNYNTREVGTGNIFYRRAVIWADIANAYGRGMLRRLNQLERDKMPVYVNGKVSTYEAARKKIRQTMIKEIVILPKDPTKAAARLQTARAKAEDGAILNFETHGDPRKLNVGTGSLSPQQFARKIGSRGKANVSIVIGACDQTQASIDAIHLGTGAKVYGDTGRDHDIYPGTPRISANPNNKRERNRLTVETVIDRQELQSR